MHPGFAYWWRAHGRRGHGACGEDSFGAEAHAGPGPERGPGPEGFGGFGGRERGRHGRHEHGGHHDHGGPGHHGGPPPWVTHFGGGDDGEVGGGSFGVRRPLRFLAHKLDLDDDQ